MVRFIVPRVKLLALLGLVIIVCATGTTKADFTFGEITNLGSSVNSSSGDVSPSVTPDGLELYFESYRSNNYGDLWVTMRETTEDPWGEAMNLGPTVNTSGRDGGSSISTDGLELYFASDRPGGSGTIDIWMTRRATRGDDWGSPVNLGSTVNSEAAELRPAISSDGLQLYFCDHTVLRTGGYGQSDLWMTSRLSVSDPWGLPVNLGPTVNSSAHDRYPSISGDGRALFFSSNRSGGQGNHDIWFSRWVVEDEDWGLPVNLGPLVNSSFVDAAPTISADGDTLYFYSTRPGGYGDRDLYEVPVCPIVDFNGDEVVDVADIDIMLECWGTDDSLCDIGPMPWGDGVVDVEDLVVLVEHIVAARADAEDADVGE